MQDPLELFTPQIDALSNLEKLKQLINSGAFGSYDLRFETSIYSQPSVAIGPDSESSLLRLEETLKRHRAVDIESWTLSPMAGQGNRSSLKFIANRSEYVSRLSLSTINQSQNVNKILDAVAEAFELIRKPDAVIRALPEHLQQQIMSESNATAVMREQTARLTELVTQSVAEATEREAQVRRKLEDEWTQRRIDLEAEYSEKHARISKRESALVSKENELRLREHRGVRRETMQELLTETQNLFKASVATTTGAASFVKGSIWTACLSLIMFTVVAVALALRSGVINTESQSGFIKSVNSFPVYLLIGPGVASIIVFVSTLVAYTRWLRRNHDTLLQMDIFNRKTRVDMIRASWLAEFMLEAKNPTDPERQQPLDLPNTFLEQLSRGLFEHGESQCNENPIDELQRYAKQFKRLTVGPVSIESKSDEPQK